MYDIINPDNNEVLGTLRAHGFKIWLAEFILERRWTTVHKADDTIEIFNNNNKLIKICKYH